MKPLRKKSQMKTFESVAVLIIFFILIGLGLIFYTGVQKTSMKQIYTERVEQEAVKMAMRVSYLPEILCSRRKIVEDDCFDVYKLDSVSSWISRDEKMFLYYQGDFKESVITIKQIFPYGRTFTIYSNQPEQEKMKDYYIIPTYIPVSLKNSSMKNENSIGLLNVTMFVPKV
ncbi:hypothetical protein COV19_06450 [Candidatus Woesearchaeota archaeon CG10_big_fil_rev_8_21_14_0_10_44_13]|nr:MAG: hypothetical protein COV19_06450 [Candidatus Woesearchaeota archaeon CG10_big_fil_rev_8_21_14_0_10_44_13]